jgi:predicted Zn-dependent protease
MTESLPSPEFVFPILAATKLDANSGKVAAALETVRAARAKADPGSRAAITYAEAILLAALGKDQEAGPRFQEALKSGDLMIQYLALTAMNQMLGVK